MHHTHFNFASLRNCRNCCTILPCVQKILIPPQSCEGWITVSEILAQRPWCTLLHNYLGYFLGLSTLSWKESVLIPESEPFNDTVDITNYFLIHQRHLCLLCYYSPSNFLCIDSTHDSQKRLFRKTNQLRVISLYTEKYKVSDSGGSLKLLQPYLTLEWKIVKLDLWVTQFKLVSYT